jgi:hypothetical protein
MENINKIIESILDNYKRTVNIRIDIILWLNCFQKINRTIFFEIIYIHKSSYNG